MSRGLTIHTPCSEGPHIMAVGCVHCVSVQLSTMTLACVELWFEGGLICRDALDGYRHVWAISAPRSKAYDHWMSYPDTELAREYARELIKIIPGGRAYC